MFSKAKIGDVVVLVHRGNRPGQSRVNITKVGRKWVYVSNHRTKYSMATGVSDAQYGYSDILMTEEAAARMMRIESAEVGLRRMGVEVRYGLSPAERGALILKLHDFLTAKS